MIAAAGAATIAFVPGAKRSWGSLFAAAKTDMITALVRPGKLAVIVKERGSLESAANKDVLCDVEGGTTIIRILPEGTRVKEGQIVCELESATLKDSLTNQKITTQQAEASYKQSALTREVAEYAVKEYTEGVYKQDYETAKGEIALAKSDLERATDRMTWSKNMFGKGYVSKAASVADELSLEKSKFSLEQSQTQLDVLEKYTKDKQTKSLRSDVEKARADELSKQSSWELEKIKEAKLERQIRACVLKAPTDGIVVYANDPNRFGGQQALQIEEGAAVRERQKIFSLPDITKMRVNTKVHESMVARVKPGLRSLVRVETAATQELRGQVASVAPMSDSGSFFSSDIKVYTTLVAIDGDTAKLDLRPGMNAQVEILITELDNVLSVPVPAILPFKGKDYVFIKDGETFRRAEVTLGISNDSHIEIKTGLKAGDLVAMTPVTLLTEDERREAFSVASRDAAKKDFGDAAPKGAGGDEGGAPGEGKAKAKGKGGRGGGGGGMGGMMNGPMAEKFQKISPEDQTKMRSGTDEERTAIMKGAGFTDEEIEQMAAARRNRGAGGGGGGGPRGEGGGGGRGGEGGGGGGRGGYGGGGGGAGGPGQ